MTERAQNADFRRKPQIFADSPLLLEIQAFGGRRKPQKTADLRRKPKIFAENRRKPQIGLRHLRCVTFSSALDGAESMGISMYGFMRKFHGSTSASLAGWGELRGAGGMGVSDGWVGEGEPKTHGTTAYIKKT